MIKAILMPDIGAYKPLIFIGKQYAERKRTKPERTIKARSIVVVRYGISACK